MRRLCRPWLFRHMHSSYPRFVSCIRSHICRCTCPQYQRLCSLLSEHISMRSTVERLRNRCVVNTSSSVCFFFFCHTMISVSETRTPRTPTAAVHTSSDDTKIRPTMLLYGMSTICDAAPTTISDAAPTTISGPTTTTDDDSTTTTTDDDTTMICDDCWQRCQPGRWHRAPQSCPTEQTALPPAGGRRARREASAEKSI